MPALRRSLFWPYVSAGLVTAAGALTTTILTARRRELGERFRGTAPEDVDYLRAGDAWRALRMPTLTVAALTSVAGVATSALYGYSAPPPRARRWISIAAGTLGAGFAAWGIAELARGSACTVSADASACVDAETPRDRGALLGLAAAPLLTLGLTGAFRWHFSAEASARPPTIGVTFRAVQL